MTRLYLVRHGKPRSTWGGADPDPGLDEQGWEQARAARDTLLALPVAERPTRVVSSPLRRCRETAQPTAEALGLEIEIDPAVGEIPTPQAVAAADRPAWLREAFGGRWADVRGDLDYLGWRRAVVASLAYRGESVVFSHYVAINAVLSHIGQDDRVLVYRPDHASITVLEVEGGDLRLIARGVEADTEVH